MRVIVHMFAHLCGVLKQAGEKEKGTKEEWNWRCRSVTAGRGSELNMKSVEIVSNWNTKYGNQRQRHRYCTQHCYLSRVSFSAFTEDCWWPFACNFCVRLAKIFNRWYPPSKGHLRTRSLPLFHGCQANWVSGTLRVRPSVSFSSLIKYSEWTNSS